MINGFRLKKDKNTLKETQEKHRAYAAFVTHRHEKILLHTKIKNERIQLNAGNRRETWVNRVINNPKFLESIGIFMKNRLSSGCSPLAS